MPIKDDSLETYGRKHPVPQNVMDVEFKIVGDMSIRQFMYLVAGSLIAYIIYKSGMASFWRWAMMFLVGGISASVAFLPIEGRGMDIWLANFIRSMFKPAQRVWTKSEVIPSYFLSDYSNAIEAAYTITQAKNKNKLTDYLSQIDNDNDLEDSQQSRLSEISSVFNLDPSSVYVKQEIYKKEKEQAGSNIQADLATPTKADSIVDELSMKADLLNAMTAKPVIEHQDKITVDRPLINISPKLKGEIKLTHQVREDAAKKKIKEFEHVLEKVQETVVIAVPSSTTETTATQKPQQNALQVVDIKAGSESLEQQVIELKKTTQLAKEQFIDKPHDEKYKANKVALFSKKLFELKTEREKLNFKITQKKNSDSVEKEKELIDALKEQNKNLASQLNEIKKDLENIKQTGPQDKSNTKMVQPVTNPDNNMIEGKVIEFNENPVVEAVIIIKDKNGDVVRALKSNQLGEFKTQTPISNGSYTINVIKSGLSFDIISINIGDEPLGLVILKAKG